MLEFRKGLELKGRYVIQDVIGTGGNASVWKASDKQLSRDVAIKRLLKYGAPSAEEASRLLDEARKSAALVHTNIVQVYDIIEVEKENLLILEFVDGQSLYELLRERARKGEALPLDSAVSILRDILAGVSFAHTNNICHRDLSPANILLTRSGIPKIADFGIARPLTAAPQVDGTVPAQAGTGTPSFMSPEQARGEPADDSSDLFMVGIIGYLLLSGRHPFAHSSGLFDISENIKDAEYLPVPPSLPSGLTTTEQRRFREYAAVIMRLLHRERAGRFASALEAVDAIEAVTPSLDCPACGEKVPDTHKFCGFCGASLESKVPSSPSAPGSTSADPDLLVEEGFRFTREGRLESAIEKYRAALKIEPEHPKALWNLGFALNRLGRYKEAVEALDRGLATKAGNGPSMFYERSYAHAYLKQYDEALRDIDEAVRSRSDSFQFLWQRARVHSFRGEDEAAKRDAKEVLRLNPAHAGALRLAGETT